LLHARQATPSAKAAAYQREANMVHILQLLDGGMLHWNPWQVIAYTLLTTHLTIVAVTVYLHRSQAHHALELHPAVSNLFRFWLWIATGMITREWVAVHRKHHAFTDQEGDPHSPLLAGFWSVQLGNVVHYVRTAHDPEVIERYARDIEEGWWDRQIFKRGWLGLTLGTLVLVAVLGLGWGLLAAGIHAVMYIFVLSSSINGLCHTVGYRNFDNTATNIRLIALLTGGEGLHNNHHGFPRSPKFSWRQSGKLEIDPAWPIIRTLIALNLAKPYKTIEQSA
jgi:stearoyl-CoA desaturase (delta-9 desaturase)